MHRRWADSLRIPPCQHRRVNEQIASMTPIDELGPVNAKKTYPIHRPAPEFGEMDTQARQLLTGIKAPPRRTFSRVRCCAESS